MVKKIISSNLFKRYSLLFLAVVFIFYIVAFCFYVNPIYNQYIQSLDEVSDELVVSIEKEIREKGAIYRQESIESLLEEARFYNKNIKSIEVYDAFNPKILFSTKTVIEADTVPKMLIDYINDNKNSELFKSSDFYLLLRTVRNPVDDIVGVVFIDYDNSEYIDLKYDLAKTLLFKFILFYLIVLLLNYVVIYYVLYFYNKKEKNSHKSKNIALSKAQIFKIKKAINIFLIVLLFMIELIMVSKINRSAKELEFKAFIGAINTSSLIVKNKTENLLKYIGDISYIAGGDDILNKYFENYKFVRYAIITDLNGRIISDIGDVNNAFYTDDEGKIKLKLDYKNIAVAIRDINSNVIGWLQVGAKI